MDYSKIITIEPGKRSGQPCIRGMRITVYDRLVRENWQVDTADNGLRALALLEQRDVAQVRQQEAHQPGNEQVL